MSKVLIVLLLLFAPTFAMANASAQSNTQPTIDGNAFELIPKTPNTGTITILQQTEPNDDGLISFVIRNDTAETAEFIKAVLVVRDLSGNEIARVDEDAASQIKPQSIKTGEIGIGYIFAGDISDFDPYPEGSTYEISIAPFEEVIDWDYPSYLLDNFEFQGDDTFRGSIYVAGDQGSFLFFVIVACFDDNGALDHSGISIVTQEIKTGENLTMEIEFEDGVGECSRFLIAAGEI